MYNFLLFLFVFYAPLSLECSHNYIFLLINVHSKNILYQLYSHNPIHKESYVAAVFAGFDLQPRICAAKLALFLPENELQNLHLRSSSGVIAPFFVRTRFRAPI
jgi:hypothetical protein